jgi:hypothetical protein
MPNFIKKDVGRTAAIGQCDSVALQPATAFSLFLILPPVFCAYDFSLQGES